MNLGATARRAALLTAGTAGLLALFVLGAMAILPMVVPAGELRLAAAQAISGSTGREAQFAAEPSLSILPSPRIELGKVVFPLPGGGALDAEGAVVRLKLLPLLTGGVEVADITLWRPTLALTGPRTPPPFALSALIARPDLPELRIVDGTIAWRTPQGLTTELVSGINASLDRTSSGVGIAAVVQFVWREAPVQAALVIDDASAFLAGERTATLASLGTEGSRVRFKGRAAYRDALSADGEVVGDTPSLRGILQWIGGTAPTAGGFGAFHCTARVAAEDNAFSFTDVSLDLDGNRADGGLILKQAGARTLVQGTFAADLLDLSPYGRMALTASGGREWDHRPLDLKALTTADLDLRLSASRVKADDSQFTRVAASAVLRGGRLALSLGEAEGWGGRLRASLTLAAAPADASGAYAGTAAVRIEAEATDVNLEKALTDIAGLKRLDGTGSLQLAVEGEGASIRDIAQDVTGTLSVSGTKGAILGLDVAQVLHRIERRPLSGGSDVRGGRTAYDTLSAKLTIRKGTADVDEMRIEGKLVRLALGGVIAVGPRDLDLAGRASLISSTSAAGFDLPFVVQGPWSDPLLLLDPQSLIQRSDAAQPLLESVRSKVGPAAVRSVIEQLGRSNIAVPAAPATAPAAAPAN